MQRRALRTRPAGPTVIFPPRGAAPRPPAQLGLFLVPRDPELHRGSASCLCGLGTSLNIRFQPQTSHSQEGLGVDGVGKQWLMQPQSQVHPGDRNRVPETPPPPRGRMSWPHGRTEGGRREQVSRFETGERGPPRGQGLLVHPWWALCVATTCPNTCRTLYHARPATPVGADTLSLLPEGPPGAGRLLQAHTCLSSQAGPQTP